MCATHIEGLARLGAGCAGVMLVGLKVSCMIRLQSGLLCQFIANIPWLISLTTVGRSRHDYNFWCLILVYFIIIPLACSGSSAFVSGWVLVFRSMCLLFVL